MISCWERETGSTMNYHKSLIRCFARLIGVLVLLNNYSFAQNVVSESTVVSNADKYLGALYGQGQFSGSVLVARHGKVLLSKGYGAANLEYGILNTPQTKFLLASLTKEFTATAIMMLQERGQLNVSDSICKYVPECPAAWQPITLHHLLNHSSGIPEFSKFPDIDCYRRKSTTIAETVERAKIIVPVFKPGEKFGYSSLGYVLLGHVIEKVSGKSYETFLEDNIFEPLGMKDTGLLHPKMLIKHRAAGYAREKDGSLRNAPFYELDYISAAGGLYSTVGDLYLFDQALYTGKLLKPETLAAMFKPGIENTGYAWEIYRQFNRQLVRADGRSWGFSNSLTRYPADKVTVIVLSNIESAGAHKIADNLGAIVFGERYDKLE